MHLHLIEPDMFRSDMSSSSFKVNFNMSQVPVETDPSRSQLSQKKTSINAIWHLVQWVVSIFGMHVYLMEPHTLRCDMSW